MKEEDYLTVTTLAQLRIAMSVLSPLPDLDELTYRNKAVRALSVWIELLEKKAQKINITE